MTNSTATILRWSGNLDQIEYYRSFNWDDIDAIPVEANYVPPFQMVRSKTGDQITLFKLVNFKTGVETDVTTEIISVGLRVGQYTNRDYDLIIYPSNSVIPVSILPIGIYYAVMSDGTNTWYSELIQFCSSVGNMVRLEWCHAGEFEYSGGHIDYTESYTNWVYLKTDIGRPSYPYFEEGTDRDGRFFPHKQISYKLWKMNFFATESMLDALRLVRLHDTRNLVNNNDGREYELTDFLFGNPTWMEARANIAFVESEFRTDTVSVISGRGVLSTVCGSEQPGGGQAPCLAFTYSFVAAIESGSAEYIGQYYVPAGGGPNVPFQTGDRIMIYDGVLEIWKHYTFNGSGYDLEPDDLQDTIGYDHNEGRYYWQNINPSGNIWLRPWISAIVNKDQGGQVTSSPRLWTAYGGSLAGATIEVFTFDEFGTETLAGVGTSSDFAGLGIEFIWTTAAIGIRIKLSSGVCNRFDTSEDFLFEGVNYWIIEDDNIVQ